MEKGSNYAYSTYEQEGVANRLFVFSIPVNVNLSYHIGMITRIKLIKLIVKFFPVQEYDSLSITKRDCVCEKASMVMMR